MIDNKAEYIICAAIWVDDGLIYLHQPANVPFGYVVCGRRHHNCFMTVSAIIGDDVSVFKHGNVTQGFITSADRFLNRKDAGELAFIAGQIDKETDCLFSEDLY